jgi:O-antigen ligase
MQRLFLGMSAAGALLSLEGLVQSKSAHPYWLYSVLRVPGAGAHEAGIYGPYLNRDHFSNLIAMAGSVAAALLALAARDGAFKNLSSFAKSERFGRNVGLLIALFLILVASAASGSRGGLIALGVGLLVGLGPVLVARPRLGLAACGLFALALFGAGAPDAFVRMTDIDFEVSRLLVWRDVVRLIEFFPVFGCGLGAFAPAYWPYQRVVRFEYWSHAHNEYLQALLEGGIAGILLGAYALRLGWIALPRIIRNAEARPALAGLAAAMTHAFVDSGFRVPANAAWASLLLICAVVRPSGKTEGDA